MNSILFMIHPVHPVNPVKNNLDRRVGLKNLGQDLQDEQDKKIFGSTLPANCSLRFRAIEKIILKILFQKAKNPSKTFMRRPL
jgi:hypothetical protein